MSLSLEQLSANRANAQHSTGPRTEAGKKISRLNSTRHGITGKTIIMTSEQMALYQKFAQEMADDWQPQGAQEKILVETLVDTYWRLNCARSQEMALFAINHDEAGAAFETGHPEIHAAVTAVRVLSNKTDELKLLSLYEQRLNRTQQTAMKQLRELQAERKQREAGQMMQAAEIQKMCELKEIRYQPSDSGFVFSSSRFETWQVLQEQLQHVQIAKEVRYDKEKFLTAIAHR